MKLAQRIRNAIEDKVRELCAGSLDYAEAERRAIRAVAAAERTKLLAGRANGNELFERPGATKTQAIPSGVLEAAAAQFRWAMMKPITREQLFGLPPSTPASSVPSVARPRPAPKNARVTTGEPQATQPQPVEPQLPATPLLYVSNGPRGSAMNITEEFRNDPATSNWRADERRRGLL
jgi:hypothetical protein